MTKKREQLRALINNMTADEVSEVFDIDVWQIANEDMQSIDEEASLDEFIDECKAFINSRKE